MKHQLQPTRPRVRLNAISVAKIMSAMIGGSASMAEMEKATGLAYNTILSYIRAMRVEGVCHVSCWDKDSSGRVSIARHAVGRFPDARKPIKPRAQTAREQRIKRKIRATMASHQHAAS